PGPPLLARGRDLCLGDHPVPALPAVSGRRAGAAAGTRYVARGRGLGGHRPQTVETLNDILEESARKYDGKPALIIRPGFRTRTWAYRDLADIVPRVARHLPDSGLRPGDRVVIWGANRPEHAIALLATLRLGAVLVPLDMNSLVDFAQRVAERTKAGAAIVSKQTLERARSLGIPLHEMELLPDLARNKEPLAKAALAGDALAEVVFTSGTTGEPKGAMLTHGNVLSNALAATKIFPLAPHQRLLSFVPICLRRLLFRSVHGSFGGRFRYIVSGAAALDPALGEAWRDMGVDVLQGYGMTECSPALTFNRLGRNRLGSVGVPLPGVEVRTSEDGEVLARGPNVFKGYWQNDEATQAALAGGWYHTGDL